MGCSRSAVKGLKTGRSVWHDRYHLGGQSKSCDKRKIMVLTRERVLNVKYACGQIVRPGEMSN